MSITPRTVGLSVLGVAIVGALMFVSFRTDPVPVDLHLATRGPMQVTVNADGKTRIRDLYEIASPITGTARRAPVQVGDRVKGGETVVAIVEPATPVLLDTRSRRQAEASVQEARAALHVAETDLQKALEEQVYAKSQFDRIETLVRRNVSSVTQLETAQQRLAISDASVEAARARIDMARSTLERAEATLIDPDPATPHSEGCCVRLLAPVDGVVLSTPTISAHPVVSGSLLATIGDPSELEIVVDLLSSDAVRLPTGAKARIERWGGPSLDAVLERIEPVARTKVSALGIEEQRVDSIFRLTSDSAGLGDGFSVFARIIEWEADDALQIPVSALFRQGEGWHCFVAIGGQVELRRIKIGRRNTLMAQVLDGLAEGERVVTHPGDRLEPGAAITERVKL